MEVRLANNKWLAFGLHACFEISTLGLLQTPGSLQACGVASQVTSRDVNMHVDFRIH
jgi:hypothetical protein